MVRLFVVLGFALLAGGAYAIVDGWPYRVLERGFTEVILGGLSLVGGLILLALAVVLAEVRRLKGLVSGAMAAVALSEPRPAGRPALNEELARGEPTPEKAPENAPIPEAGHGGRAATLAAGAGAAVVAGALAGLAKSEDAPDVKATDRTDETADEVDTAGEGDGARSDRAQAVAAEPSQAPSAAAGEIDDWLRPPASPERDAAPLDVPPDERGDSDEADAKTEGARDESERPLTAGEAAGKIESAGGTVDETEVRPAGDELGAAKPETAPASSAEDQLWWPRIDRPAREEAASVDDEFNALRDQLAGVVNAPDVEPPRRDRDDKDTAESWTAPRPWPPVTQPRDPGALSEVEAEAGDKAPPEDAENEPAPFGGEPSLPEPELAGEPAITAADVSPVEKTEPAAAEANLDEAKPDEAKPDVAEPDEVKPDEEPAASDEGVIGAYQVGETQFTMFADGSIHARTPDGDYTFASMEELKAYLASEKDKLGA